MPVLLVLLCTFVMRKRLTSLHVLAELQDMEKEDMVNTLLTNLQVEYDAYHYNCYPNECTLNLQKTMYVLIVEFLGALGGLIQIILGLGSLVLWPMIMCCCHWKSGDRAWDPEQDEGEIPSAAHSHPKGKPGSY